MGQSDEESVGASGQVALTAGRWRRLAAIVLLLALLVRLAYVFETNEVPTVRHLIGDAAGYYAWGQRIAAGEWIGNESFYQAPLYPYILGVCFSVFGDDVAALRIGQCVWGAVGVLLLWFAASRMFSRRAGIVAGLMLAIYAPAIFFDGIVQKAWLGCLLLCALLAAMAWTTGARRVLGAFIVGALCGLLTLTRENAMVWFLVLGPWMWLVWRGQGRKLQAVGVAVYLLGVVCTLGPVAARNAAACGEWSPSTFQAGANFYIGNHSGADGRYQPLARGHETPEFERRDAMELAERALGRSLSPREVSRYWAERAWSDIRDDPLGWLSLLGRKMLMVWNRYEVADGESVYVYAESSSVLGVLGGVWHFGVLCPLAALGFVATWADRRRLWVYYALIVSMAAAVAAFYVLARYRFPLVPLLIPFAAAGCVWTWDRLRSGEYRALSAPVLAAAVVAVIVNWPIHDERRLDAMARMNVGVALARGGDLDGATEYFRSALRVHSGSAEAHNNLAQALALQGDYADAIEHYTAALALEPTLLGVDYNLGVAFESVGRRTEALTHYERALSHNPYDADAKAAIDRLGRHE